MFMQSWEKRILKYQKKIESKSTTQEIVRRAIDIETEKKLFKTLRKCMFSIWNEQNILSKLFKAGKETQQTDIPITLWLMVFFYSD